jgi:hypothetical protein
MIPSRQEIVYRIQGAWRLARFDASGAQYFDDNPAAALRSFFAAVLVAPAFFVVKLLMVDEAATGEPFPTFLTFALGYSLLWTVFPVVAYRICQEIGQERAFFRYISADNWAGIIGQHLHLVLVVLFVGGMIPEALAPLLGLALQTYILAYSWFIARHCLGVGPLPAVGFVALQFLVAVVVETTVAWIAFHPVAG